ncbi:hypothetical protein CYLTODRAFT_454504 [Cylindrobasidium torrendii FP15055 ss-10]|uniref:ATPase inhibitor, mitochondrial n=1 Tax=Cylindrobasidium torrendii FP15055 ss-10 TaxID=1314674 RepID=A0A0D7BAX9_9AGAR|nr:hypothetical protein CYLTODRAFT_454504 [Cylindrobasidium torrendii FP15055 ss-10]
MSASILRIANRFPRVATQARWSSSTPKDGAVSGTKAFNDKERAQESAYVRQHEAAQIEKLRAQLAQANKDLERSQSQLSDLGKKLDEVSKK